jgi:hypothetical protein
MGLGSDFRTAIARNCMSWENVGIREGEGVAKRCMDGDTVALQ